jgi:hypothetical protein
MAKKIDLKAIERKARITYHQDGLLDISAGVYLLGFSIGILLNIFWNFSIGVILPALLTAIVLPLWVNAKKRVTIPRVGYVNFGTSGQPKRTILLNGLLVLGTAFLLTFTVFLMDSSKWLITVGICVLIVSALFGYITGLKRLYGYGISALAFFAVGHFLGVFYAYILLALGIVALTAGFSMLIRFINKYPLKGENTSVQ